jgi:hypothetical protein
MDKPERRRRTSNIVRKRMKEAVQCGYMRCHHNSHTTQNWQDCPQCQDRFQKMQGRSRNLSPYDCGNPRCNICHFCKFHDIKSHHDEVADASIEDQVRDYLGGNP